MIRELKKIWRPIQLLVAIAILAGMMWNLHGKMYNGAPFLRDGMIMAWKECMEQADPLVYVQESFVSINNELTELQMQFMMSDSAAEKEQALSKIHIMQNQIGRYSNALPFDLLILSRVKARMEHIDSLAEEWQNEQTVLKRVIKRKGLDDAQASKVRALIERYSALSTPEFTNIDAYENFAQWNSLNAYALWIPLIWIAAQSVPVEKKTGMKGLICAISKSPRRIAIRKITAVMISACCLVTVQFIAGLCMSIIMTGGVRGLQCGVQAMYALGMCGWNIPIYMLLVFQLISHNALAVFAAGLTMLITSYIQDEWTTIPIAVFILVCPNILHSVFPEVAELDIASAMGVISSLAENAASAAYYVVAALALTAIMAAHTCRRFARSTK